MRWEVVMEPVPGAKFQPGERVSFGIWEIWPVGASLQDILQSRRDMTVPYMVRHAGIVVGATRAYASLGNLSPFRYTIQDIVTGKNNVFEEEELMRG